MRLNCDLGEDYGVWRISVDDKIYRFIDQANIACGFHGGDPVTIEETIKHAINHNLELGAHPSYPDIQGFGRRHMAMSNEELSACIRYQIAALKGLVEVQGGKLTYVKPHGALYNDFSRLENVRYSVLQAVSDFSGLSLMIQAHPDQQLFSALAREYSVELQFEAFIDRLYLNNGSLAPRGESGAVLNSKQALAQAKQLIEKGTVTTKEMDTLSVNAMTLCIHGDNPDALELSEQIRNLLNKV
jgi:UPF0271 protein